jgi:TP901-1 family phage major tail protein
MPAQKGQDLLLKIESSTGVFTTVAGLRTKNLSLNSDGIDTTHADSAGQWRELLAGGGVRRASLSAAGIFKDETSDALLRQAFFNGGIKNYQIIIPSFGTLEGAFQIRSLEYRGDYASELTFDIALDSAGQISFTV